MAERLRNCFRRRGRRLEQGKEIFRKLFLDDYLEFAQGDVIAKQFHR